MSPLSPTRSFLRCLKWKTLLHNILSVHELLYKLKVSEIGNHRRKNCLVYRITSLWLTDKNSFKSLYQPILHAYSPCLMVNTTLNHHFPWLNHSKTPFFMDKNMDFPLVLQHVRPRSFFAPQQPRCRRANCTSKLGDVFGIDFDL